MINNNTSQFIKITPMKAVTEMRTAIDGLAARYAAMHVENGLSPDPLLERFEEMVEVANSADYSRFRTADRVFHLSIIDMAGVEGMAETWHCISGYMNPFYAQTLRECWPDLNVLCEGHRPIVDSIADGDPSAAEHAAKSHLDAVWYRLAEIENDESLPDDALERACAYVVFHLHEPLRLNDVATSIARTSAGHLARLFRFHRGMSFTRYIRELRLQKARELMLTTKMSIQQISRQVGYSDPSRFGKHFRSRFSITPSEYRSHFSHF